MNEPQLANLDVSGFAVTDAATDRRWLLLAFIKPSAAPSQATALTEFDHVELWELTQDNKREVAVQAAGDANVCDRARSHTRLGGREL